MVPTSPHPTPLHPDLWHLWAGLTNRSGILKREEEEEEEEEEVEEEVEKGVDVSTTYRVFSFWL